MNNKVIVKNKSAVVAIGAVIGLLMIVGTTYILDIKTTNEYCMEYIQSGELPRYLEVRKEQHRILTTTEDKDVVIPEMKARYPMINMHLYEDTNMEKNVDRARYYNKNSVKAVMVE